MRVGDERRRRCRPFAASRGTIRFLFGPTPPRTWRSPSDLPAWPCPRTSAGCRRRRSRTACRRRSAVARSARRSAGSAPSGSRPRTTGRRPEPSSRPSRSLQRRDERLLEREADRVEVGRVLRLGIDADAARLGEVDHLLERRNLVAPVEGGVGGPERGIRSLARRVFSSASVKSSVNQPVVETPSIVFVAAGRRTRDARRHRSSARSRSRAGRPGRRPWSRRGRARCSPRPVDRVLVARPACARAGRRWRHDGAITSGSLALPFGAGFGLVAVSATATADADDEDERKPGERACVHRFTTAPSGFQDEVDPDQGRARPWVTRP